ncbi:MAG: hypothetical protein OM95_08050 [Bdellovibrio sp. ArHS]|uniref:protein-glutamine glutaminase family protein n=1 Tax=Bdellovibrio sp. ArHS TaxID=1569284 RepID=UPI00058359EF|nr:protein-glutamine glutaminase family protein [Bdellovibrio sp. ArHS]KHD88460.1 MAG: hypothetical protein OM95_08050 [Bdellovibrio sp. ArHS]
MRLVALFFSLLIVQTSWALTPTEACQFKELVQSAPDDFSSRDRFLAEELCSSAGVYEESLLPDNNAASQAGTSAKMTDYKEFYQSLAKSLDSFNKSEICDPKSAKYKGVVYPTVTLQKTAAGDIPVSVLTEEEAAKIFSDFAKDERYAFGATSNGCYARAHIFSQQMEKKGIRVAKMFLEGRLVIPEEKRVYEDQNIWNYHVAPVVAVKTNKGIELRVLDPALYDKPVPVKQWTDTLLTTSQDKKEALAYVTDRFNLGPLRGETLPSAKKDPNRLKWHAADTVQAQHELEARQEEQRMLASDREDERFEEAR